MDSSVQTKTPTTNRRTKFVIMGLLIVILILAYQLHSVNKKKNDLVTRKTFLIGKLYDCRASSEKTDTKYKDKKAQNAALEMQLKSKQNDYDALSRKHSDLEMSYQSKTSALLALQKTAVSNLILQRKSIKNVTAEECFLFPRNA